MSCTKLKQVSILFYSTYRTHQLASDPRPLCGGNATPLGVHCGVTFFFFPAHLLTCHDAWISRVEFCGPLSPKYGGWEGTDWMSIKFFKSWYNLGFFSVIIWKLNKWSRYISVFYVYVKRETAIQMYSFTYLVFVINTKYRRNTIIGNTFVNTYRTI